MFSLKPLIKSSVALLCLVVFGAQFCLAQQLAKVPTTWWPDPSTGLMWAGQAYEPPPSNPRNPWDAGVPWQEANNYCASLKLGGFSGWRLPTLAEVRTATVIRKVSGPHPAYNRGENRAMNEQDDWVSQIPSDMIFFKGDIDISTCAWTSDQKDSLSAFTSGKILVPWDAGLPLTSHAAALCTRPMETDLLQIAKDAQVKHPVPDIETLKAYIPLSKARMAFQASHYQESVAQAQSALALKTEPATAYWGLGISYGMLGQWDQAISDLQSALKIDKNYKDAKTALKWAKDGQQAARKGRDSKDKPPVWN